MPEKCIYDCLLCGKCAKNKFAILSDFQAELIQSGRKGLGIAVDIGTTSVVLVILDLSTCKIITRRSFMNPQRIYGADVISRINAAGKGHLDEMRKSITEALHEAIDDMVKKHELLPEAFAEIIIAGNTTMVHLLLGLTCVSLGVSPFKTKHELKAFYSYEEIFGKPFLNCGVKIIPWLAGFVGGDITSGLLYILHKDKGRFLLVDLGTNGEIALYSEGRLFITSTAAGPAFEGGRSGGASYILDKLAEHLREGIIDENGHLMDEASSAFTQKDIRDLQLAKSAIRSGIEILLETAGLTYDELDTVYLAGGIGQTLNKTSAAETGLLPYGLVNKTQAVGNASLGGAAALLLAPENEAIIQKLKADAVEVNLSEQPKFNDYFVDYMFFL